MEKIIKVETPTQSQTEINLSNNYDFSALAISYILTTEGGTDSEAPLRNNWWRGLRPHVAIERSDQKTYLEKVDRSA